MFKLSKLIKGIFLAAVIVLCLLLTWALVLFVLGLAYQWWVKAMILTCLGASLVIALILRKLWLKRREMKFVDGIVGTDDMPGSISAVGDASRELRRRFKEAVATLKKSDLKRKGNPLYVLPWYLIVGKSGAGKSTAIKSARLPSPFGDINRVSGIEGTRNCDWWFFDQSVVIDIAGRYSVHRNEALDKSEWLAFLEHLVKYRKKEPINGIIVTVEADQLLEGDLEKIEDEGRTIRKRINEVINVMGAKLPIYVLVTKCDLIFGMNRFYQLLSESSREQAMGLMNHDAESEIGVFVNHAMDTMVDKLKDIRLILANKDEVRERHYIEPEVLVFPDEFARLRHGLMSFCKGAFKDNPFQELPVMRGIYFCSGQQVGRPIGYGADTLSKLFVKELPGTGNGFFLSDFFAAILPADRSLYARTSRAKEWHRLTQNLWLTGFATIALIFCILLTHSWNENKTAINLISPQFRKPILFKNDPVADIGIMAAFGRDIRTLEEHNNSRRFPHLGLFAAQKLELDLKKRYCKRYYEHFDADTHLRIESRIADGGWQQDDYAPAARFIPLITRRINLLKVCFSGDGAGHLASLPDPDYTAFLENRELPARTEELTQKHKTAFLDYLIWQSDPEPLNASLTAMQRLLRNYFQENQGDLRWLVRWASEQPDSKAITLNYYWQNPAADKDTVVVPPAFTCKGRQHISRFVTGELEKAVDQKAWIAVPKAGFAVWYRNAYYTSWMEFCKNFGKGVTLFRSEDARAGVIQRLTGEQSPYTALLDTLTGELSPASPQQWPSLEPAGDEEARFREMLSQIKDFASVRRALAADTGSDTKATEKLTRALSPKARAAAEMAMYGMAGTDLAKATRAYQRYRAALSGFDGMTASSLGAYEVARQGFMDDPAQAESPVLSAYKAVTTLRTVLGETQNAAGGSAQDAFWCLFTQPVDQLWKYAVTNAGCHLQKLWDEHVLVEIQGVSDRQRLAALLFGDQGCVDQYTRTHARPFMQLNSKRGYYAKTLKGCKIPFRQEYFRFMEQGKKWASESGGPVQAGYVVDVLAFPTDVNSDARVKPHLTQLVVENTQGDMSLVNRQYPIEAKFNWSPSSCGDVSLQIMLGDITLTKKYTGYCAFGKFLADFKNGKRTFTGVDFPEFSPEFYRLGVREIEVHYRFEASQIKPIVRLLTSAPGRPPVNIVGCSG
jgi:type VI secretion system protein ImpL